MWITVTHADPRRPPRQAGRIPRRAPWARDGNAGPIVAFPADHHRGEFRTPPRPAVPGHGAVTGRHPHRIHRSTSWCGRPCSALTGTRSQIRIRARRPRGQTGWQPRSPCQLTDDSRPGARCQAPVGCEESKQPGSGHPEPGPGHAPEIRAADSVRPAVPTAVLSANMHACQELLALGSAHENPPDGFPPGHYRVLLPARGCLRAPKFRLRYAPTRRATGIRDMASAGRRS
jgi:hypothetical protein